MSLFSDLMNDEGGETSPLPPPAVAFHSPKTKEPKLKSFTPFTLDTQTNKTTQLTTSEAFRMLVESFGYVDGEDVWEDAIEVLPSCGTCASLCFRDNGDELNGPHWICGQCHPNPESQRVLDLVVAARRNTGVANPEQPRTIERAIPLVRVWPQTREERRRELGEFNVKQKGSSP